MKISIIIPTLNSALEIEALIQKLLDQTISPDEIVIIDSSSTDKTIEKVSPYSIVRTIVIPREDFNHGATRHRAFLESSGDIVCFLTQDAMPKDEHYLANLLKPFDIPEVALCSGRQEPKQDAYRYVSLVQSFNYPETSNIRSMQDVSKLGIKAFFASDACSAYRREAYFECGGFQRVNTNEDMLMAASLLQHGWKVAYVADAVVKHSHNLSIIEQYQRNFEIGVFLETYSSDLIDCGETEEGLRLVNEVTRQLIKERSFGEVFRFGFDCAARLLGNRRGRRSVRKNQLSN